MGTKLDVMKSLIALKNHSSSMGFRNLAGIYLTIKAALEALGIMSRHERMPMMALKEPEYLQVKDLIYSLPLSDFITI